MVHLWWSLSPWSPTTRKMNLVVWWRYLHDSYLVEITSSHLDLVVCFFQFICDKVNIGRRASAPCLPDLLPSYYGRSKACFHMVSLGGHCCSEMLKVSRTVRACTIIERKLPKKEKNAFCNRIYFAGKLRHSFESPESQKMIISHAPVTNNVRKLHIVIALEGSKLPKMTTVMAK